MVCDISLFVFVDIILMLFGDVEIVIILVRIFLIGGCSIWFLFELVEFEKYLIWKFYGMEKFDRNKLIYENNIIE